MAQAVVTLAKAAVSVLVVIGVGYAAIFALALFLEPWHSTHCAHDIGVICGTALAFIHWWWLVFVLAFIPVSTLVSVFFFRKWLFRHGRGA